MEDKSVPSVTRRKYHRSSTMDYNMVCCTKVKYEVGDGRSDWARGQLGQEPFT